MPCCFAIYHTGSEGFRFGCCGQNIAIWLAARRETQEVLVLLCSRFWQAGTASDLRPMPCCALSHQGRRQPPKLSELRHAEPLRNALIAYDFNCHSHRYPAVTFSLSAASTGVYEMDDRDAPQSHEILIRASRPGVRHPLPAQLSGKRAPHATRTLASFALRQPAWCP